ncbi:MAG: prolyl oligopeptidase family serine peptidase, partial [Pseudomonadales bacterium]
MNRTLKTTLGAIPGVFLPLTVAALLTVAHVSRAATFSPLDVFELEWVTDPRVSPDGGTIAYTRNGFDVMTDRRVSRIWLIDADGKHHRPLTDRAGSSPRWSPSGDRVAFLSSVDEAGGVEVFMHWIAENRTAHITRLTADPSNLQFSPDGQWLAFGMFKPQPSAPLVKGPTPPEGAKWAPPFKVYDAVQYRADGQGYLKPGFNHIYVIPAEGGSPRQITQGDFHHRAFGWGRDANSIIVSANRNADWEYQPVNSDLHQIDLSTGEITQLTDRYGPDAQPVVSPDGRFLAYTGFDDAHRGYENRRLYLREIASGETRSLTNELDRSVGSPIFSADSRSIYVQYDESGLGRIVRVDRNGRIRVLANDLGGTAVSRPYSGGSFHLAKNTIAYTQSAPGRPAELAVIRAGKTHLLTALNADLLDHRALASVATVRFPSRLDGREIEAWIATPPGFEAGLSYPLILEIHGGPFSAYGPHFSTEVQLYAAAGYVVIYVNPRGSTGYGEDFANQIHHAYPGGDFDDLMSAVDYAVEEGIADEQRLFVTGGSGGGILTAWIITHSDRFRAAVSVKPVINWYSFVLTADSYIYFQRYWFDKPPWEDPESYLARSPLHFVDRVTTPTMLMTGVSGHRTPISEAEQFYQALKI